MSMKMDRKRAAFLRDAVAGWRERGLLPEAQAAALDGDIEVVPFDWKRVAKFSFWIALACLVIAAGAALADQAFLALLRSLCHLPAAAQGAVLAGAAAALYAWGLRRRKAFPERRFSNEAVLFLGVVATAGAIFRFGAAFPPSQAGFTFLLLAACLVYAGIGFAVRSPLIWLFALLSLGGWFGAETGYESGWGAYFLGMNYPLRFIAFGGCLTAAAMTFAAKPRFASLARTTQAMGLLYLFLALWILSIFGNYGDIDSWNRVKQAELLQWSLLFGTAAVASVWHGIRFQDGMTRGFGLTFLFLNLYTRYFEFFWDGLHKAVFFALLGGSFWLLGLKAEKLWNLGSRE